MKKYDLIHSNQSGFRENHSCHTALINLLENLLSNINNNELCGVLFVDFAKAFDVINHELLLRKLAEYRLSPQTLCLLSSFLAGREQSVCVNSTMSSKRPVLYGVPQGSVLGPLLFSLYINDLPFSINDDCELFADDTTIHTSDKKLDKVYSSLQNSVDDLINWTEYNHMSLHPQKTKYMLITTRQKRQNIKNNPHSLLIGNDAIAEVEEHKVLGVNIDNNLSWAHHVRSLCKTMSRKIYLLNRIKHFLDPHSRLLFFNAYIQTITDYCSTIWDSASANILKPLYSLHRRALKSILLKQSSLVLDDYKKLKMLPLKERFKSNKGVLLHKILSGHAPRAFITKFKTKPNRKFNVPIPRIDLFKSSLAYSGSVLWNSLPELVRVPTSLNTFKKHLSLHLMSNYEKSQ